MSSVPRPMSIRPEEVFDTSGGVSALSSMPRPRRLRVGWYDMSAAKPVVVLAHEVQARDGRDSDQARRGHARLGGLRHGGAGGDGSRRHDDGLGDGGRGDLLPWRRERLAVESRLTEVLRVVQGVDELHRAAGLSIEGAGRDGLVAQLIELLIEEGGVGRDRAAVWIVHAGAAPGERLALANWILAARHEDAVALRDRRREGVGRQGILAGLTHPERQV